MGGASRVWTAGVCLCITMIGCACVLQCYNARDAGSSNAACFRWTPRQRQWQRQQQWQGSLLLMGRKAARLQATGANPALPASCALAWHPALYAHTCLYIHLQGPALTPTLTLNLTLDPVADTGRVRPAWWHAGQPTAGSPRNGASAGAGFRGRAVWGNDGDARAAASGPRRAAGWCVCVCS